MSLTGNSKDAERIPLTVRLGSAERDLLALGIAVAAILMLVSTGGAVVPQIVRAWVGRGPGPDAMLANALLLNIALIIFGWRRYAQLSHEIGERKLAEENARVLAETDPLTGLLNRRCIVPVTAQLVAAARQSGNGIAMLMLDLDNFKPINDLNGHAAGDQVLIEVSRRMERLMPAGSALARIGGDEFAAVIAFDRRSPDKVDQLAACLIDAVDKPFAGPGMQSELTVSVGIAQSEDVSDADAAECAEALLQRADIAMYHAKKQGRNRYAWFEASMENELRFRSELELGIKRGISRGEFVPFYEQQIDLETGDLVGFEMLARWRSPELGLVSPEIFIPIAEEIGVIAELSESLMRQAFEDAKKWNPRLTLSVNISPIQLRDPWFSQKLLRLLVDTGFPPARLDIEITESCVHENLGAVRSVLTSLKNQGIQISLDDFGTGYSSLSQLRSLPFDRLKIDRSFVSELAAEGANTKIVEAIVALGRGLSLPVTAEGIENRTVLKALQKMGQLKGQGYHYGRPEDSVSTIARLTRRQLLAQLGEAEAAQPAASELPVIEEGGKQAAG